VAVLADETMSTGPHAIDWNATAQPSGVYFCRLTMEAGVESRTMVVIRWTSDEQSWHSEDRT